LAEAVKRAAYLNKQHQSTSTPAMTERRLFPICRYETVHAESKIETVIGDSRKGDNLKQNRFLPIIAYETVHQKSIIETVGCTEVKVGDLKQNIIETTESMNAYQGLKQNLATPAKPPCPYCGSTDTIRKGRKYYKRTPSVQRFKCKSCRRCFPEKRASKKVLPDDIAKSYLLHETSLDAVLEERKIDVSRTTLFRRIGAIAKDAPGWRELLKAKKEKGHLGLVMGIDTSTIKIRGIDCTYLHVGDVTSKEPLVYELIRKKDADTIKPILMELKNLGYSPIIVVSDLARELRLCIREVFPNAIIQGCIYHVTRWLEKELPTRKNIKKVDKETRILWRKVKSIIRYICISETKLKKTQYLEQLNRFDLDEIAKSVRRRFIRNLEFYHSLDEDKFKDFGKNILYDNLCERHIRAIKDLRDKFKGFKNSNMEATNDIVKLYWFYNVSDRSPLEKEEVSFSKKEEESFAFYMPLTILDECMNITELSEASGISSEVLKELAKKLGHIVVGNYAITENKLDTIKNRIKDYVSKTEKASLSIVMRKIEFDYTTTMELLIKFKYTCLFQSLDPCDIIISSKSLE
jgi:transposase-like protein